MLIVVVLAIGVVATILVTTPKGRRPPAADSSLPEVAAGVSTNTPASHASVSPSRLLGQWQRPDGGYVIEIRQAADDGRLDAGYFNPRPINVSRAEWRNETNSLQVFVELRDVNYPGATYKLRYVPGLDQLLGEYYQPLHQETFDVNFVRLPVAKTGN